MLNALAGYVGPPRNALALLAAQAQAAEPSNALAQMVRPWAGLGVPSWRVPETPEDEAARIVPARAGGRLPILAGGAPMPGSSEGAAALAAVPNALASLLIPQDLGEAALLAAGPFGRGAGLAARGVRALAGLGAADMVGDLARGLSGGAVDLPRTVTTGEAEAGVGGVLRRIYAPGQFDYVRRSQTTNSPMNYGVGHAMFARDQGDPEAVLDQLRSYGRGAWQASAHGAVDAVDLGPDIVRALRSAGEHETYGMPAAALARSAMPPRIVDSAGLWDDLRLVQRVWDDVLEPRGINAVRTPDGLIIFDPTLARPWQGGR